MRGGSPRLPDDSRIVRDAELVRELRIDLGAMLAYVLHHGAARAALEQGAQPAQLLLGADGIDFHAAVAKVAHKSRKFQPFGFVLREIAKADALHDTGNEIAPRDLIRGHESRNCNRGPEASAPPRRRSALDSNRSWRPGAGGEE